jgi:ATP-dependent Lon protease
MDELRERLRAKEMPEKPRQVAERELARLARVNPASPEHAVARAYVDWLLSMPWTEEAPTNLDIARARQVLDEDHYDLEDVKDRILEYLAALKLSGGRRATILCLVGPPGAGKTSLGRSVAKALGRPFHRFSLGGMRDEAEIRGHRRTYIGAMPGRLIKAVRNAGVVNPVVVLDEVDKIGSDFRGDPASALLEALDPEQNSSFVDNYLDTPYDLSKVLFITTANSLDPIPGPLLDRMEVIRLGGYTLEQKVEIAKRHLVPRQLLDNGLDKPGVRFMGPALRCMIEEHTREAGLRQLERVIGRVCRKIARKVAEGGQAPKKVLQRDLESYLDAPPFQPGPPKRAWRPGIATALAWTPTGGEILHIEANLVEPGEGRLRLTGQLGDVMKESASAALSFLRSRAKELGIPEEMFTKRDLHAHIPAGAIPKDGPSAGLAMASAFASEMLGAPVDRTLAMTGEITLKGVALPVGGVKEKALAAARAGMKRLVLPALNRRDLEKVPESIREKMEFFFVEDADEALALAIPKLGARKAAAEKKRASSRKKDL